MRVFGLRSHFFIAYAMLGSVLPFVSVFMRQERGLTDPQIGWIYSQTSLGVILVPIITTYLADRWLSNRTLIQLTYGLWSAGLTGMAITQSLAGVAVTFLMMSLGLAALNPLLNGLAVAALDEKPGGAIGSFHRTRIWGTFGFMAPSVLLFVLLGWTEVTTEAALWVGAGFGLLGMVTGFGLPAHGGRRAASAADTEADAGMASPPGRQANGGNGRGAMPSLDAARVLFSPRVIGFTLGAFLLSGAASMMYAFLPLYMTDLGIADKWVGLIINIGVASEVGFMLGADRIRRRIGLRGLMLMGTGAALVRMVLLAAVPLAPIAIASQVLHGPMVLTSILIPVIYLNAHAGPDFRNSVQGLYSMTCYGLPRLFGSPLGGYLSKLGAAQSWLTLGLQMTFGAAAVLVALGLGVMSLFMREAPSDEAE